MRTSVQVFYVTTPQVNKTQGSTQRWRGDAWAQHAGTGELV